MINDEFDKDYNESNKYLIDGIETYIEDSQSASTKKAYKDDWKHFKQYCNWSKAKLLPADYPTVAKYLVYLANDRKFKVSTIERKLSSIISK